MTQRKRGRPRTFNLDIRDILDAYRRGMTLTDIGDTVGVTGAAISYHLRRARCTPLRPGRKPTRVSAVSQ